MQHESQTWPTSDLFKSHFRIYGPAKIGKSQICSMPASGLFLRAGAELNQQQEIRSENTDDNTSQESEG